MAQPINQSEARRFYDEHFDFVSSVVSRYAESGDEASDLIQEAFIRILAALETYRGDSQLRTWIFRVATAASLDHVRKRRSHIARLVEWSTLQRLVDAPNDDPHVRAKIASAIMRLPVTLRDVFLMYDVHGWTHFEIAGSLGIPEGTSKSRLAAARSQLRAQLAGIWEELNS